MQVVSTGSMSAEDVGWGGGVIYPVGFPFRMFTETCLLRMGAPFSLLPPELAQNTALVFSSFSGHTESERLPYCFQTLQ